MSYRLQVLIPEALEARISKAAQRRRVSKGEWVRQAIRGALERPAGDRSQAADPLGRLASLEAPSADIDKMIADIEAGRG